MSKPKARTKEYGYEPNRANSLFEMENVVPTEGMRMAGKVEKHSEFMEPNKQSYGDMEYQYPYPSDVMPPLSWVGPGIGWPPVETGEDYVSEVFFCFAYYCCCDGNIIGPLKILCSYPIVQGPWVRNNDGTICTTQQGKIGSTKASICINPCGDSNCPPDVRCMIQSPPQSPKGKKKWPGQIKEMKVTMLNDCSSVGNPPCPPVSACCTGVSISGQPQMNVGTKQTLTVVNPKVGCTYEFRQSAGGGLLEGNVYTAPATNPGCVNNATINLYDKTNCVVCATITIAINGYSDLTAWAVTTWTGKKCWEQIGPGSTICDITNNTYNCAGELVYGPCAAGRQYWGYTCAECYETNTNPGCYGGGASCNALEASSPIDRRNEAMKAAGCCPAQLL